MFKIKTLGMELRQLKAMHELSELDELVNNFTSKSSIKKVVSFSDVTTTDDKGETIGLIRVLML